MGFGWLFIGYFITFMVQMNPYAVFVAPLGIAMLAYGAYKLYSYCHRFAYIYIPSAIMLLGFILSAVATLSDLIAFNLPAKSVFADGGYAIYFVGALLFHIALMLAIYDLAKKVDLPKIAGNAIRNFVVFAIYALIYAVSLLPLETIAEFNKLMAIPYIALWFLWMILNLILIFSCYMRICPEGDEDMPQRPSKFKLFDKMNDILNKKQDQIIESQRQYNMEKAKRKLEKSKNKKKK